MEEDAGENVLRSYNSACCMSRQEPNRTTAAKARWSVMASGEGWKSSEAVLGAHMNSANGMEPFPKAAEPRIAGMKMKSRSGAMPSSWKCLLGIRPSQRCAYSME